MAADRRPPCEVSVSRITTDSGIAAGVAMSQVATHALLVNKERCLPRRTADEPIE